MEVVFFYTSGMIEQKLHTHTYDIEGIFVEVDLRRTKWPVFPTYQPPSQIDEYFLGEVRKSLHKYSQTYSKFVLIGDFNAEESEPVLAQLLHVIMQLK